MPGGGIGKLFTLTVEVLPVKISMISGCLAGFSSLATLAIDLGGSAVI